MSAAAVSPTGLEVSRRRRVRLEWSSDLPSSTKDGASYQKQLDELAARGATVDDTVREVTTDDVRDACDLFTDIFQAPDRATQRLARHPGSDPAARPRCLRRRRHLG